MDGEAVGLFLQHEVFLLLLEQSLLTLLDQLQPEIFVLVLSLLQVV